MSASAVALAAQLEPEQQAHLDEARHIQALSFVVHTRVSASGSRCLRALDLVAITGGVLAGSVVLPPSLALLFGMVLRGGFNP